MMTFGGRLVSPLVCLTPLSSSFSSLPSQRTLPPSFLQSSPQSSSRSPSKPFHNVGTFRSLSSSLSSTPIVINNSSVRMGAQPFCGPLLSRRWQGMDMFQPQTPKTGECLEKYCIDLTAKAKVFCFCFSSFSFLFSFVIVFDCVFFSGRKA